MHVHGSFSKVVPRRLQRHAAFRFSFDLKQYNTWIGLMHFHVLPFLQPRHIWRSKSFLKTLALSILCRLKFTVGGSAHQSKTRVMDCNQTIAFSGKRINFNHRKKVSWAFNLEQVMYFSPDVKILQFRESEGRKTTAGSMQTNLEKKAHALKNKRFVSFA